MTMREPERLMMRDVIARHMSSSINPSVEAYRRADVLVVALQQAGFQCVYPPALSPPELTEGRANPLILVTAIDCAIEAIERGSTSAPVQECLKAALARYQALRAMPLQDHATEARRLVDEQAKDEGLWFHAQTCAEAYLQAALRKLHAAVEGQK